MARFCRIIDRFISVFIKVELSGRTNIDEDLPAVLGANHRSLADLWIGLTVFHRLGVYPGILFNRKMLPGPLAWFAEGAGVILVDKGGATKAGVDALESGRSLMVMPEGKLYWNADSPRQIGPVKPGIARMARMAGRPMIPVAVDGSEIAWPKGKWPRCFPGRRPTVIVTVGAAVNIESEDDQAESERLMSQVSSYLTDRAA